MSRFTEDMQRLKDFAKNDAWGNLSEAFKYIEDKNIPKDLHAVVIQTFVKAASNHFMGYCIVYASENIHEQIQTCSQNIGKIGNIEDSLNQLSESVSDMSASIFEGSHKIADAIEKLSKK